MMREVSWMIHRMKTQGFNQEIDRWCICPNLRRAHDDLAEQTQAALEAVPGPSHAVQEAVIAGPGPSHAVQEAVIAGPGSSHAVREAVIAGPSQAGPSQAGPSRAGPSQKGLYFKSYTLIPGTQKTHDTAILEAILEYMTFNQVLNTDVLPVGLITTFLSRKGEVS